MAEIKHVKVNNWGVFFLQRLKGFFNRTDYCDLTLQFQDNAQLKVHRLVLSACTKYFEVLERTCEMYDNCLIMPEYLQADVVVPIVNFMYTGQLEYDYQLYDRLHSTARLMNMTVLTKLLDAQKISSPEKSEPIKKEMILMNHQLANKSIHSTEEVNFEKSLTPNRKYGPAPGYRNESSSKPSSISDLDSARPTRYELPEGLDNDDLLETSFADISYESLPIIKPLKRQNTPNIYDEASTSRKFEELKRGITYKRPRMSPDTNESKRIDLEQVNEYAYQQKLRSEYSSRDDYDNDNVDYAPNYRSVNTQKKNSDNLFSHIKYGNSSKESTKQDKTNVSLNHAKIISEVLKKYPHLVNTNKNIKLKIMTDKESNSSQSYVFESNKKTFVPSSSQIQSNKDWCYVPRSASAETMANLVSLGIENTTGPWLCLLCGTSSKALKFFTYHKYYRHLVDFHKEKLHPKICEYCGFKSGKRNHLLHHMYTKHDIAPPPNYHFPKCNICSYVALTEAFLIKHKMSHVDNKDFTCSVCNSSFRTRNQLLNHIHLSGHKISPDRRISTKCVYCSKVFLREANLYTHLKISHKEIARNDGIIDNSDEDEEDNKYVQNISYEYSNDQQDEYVEVKDEDNGKILIPQKLLNSELFNKNRERVKEYEMPEKEYNEPLHIMKSEEQNLKPEQLESVGRSISNSINLVDVVVLNENEEYILPDQSTDCNSENIVLSNVQEQQTPNINVQPSPTVLKINTLKTTPKLSRSIQNLMNSQNQPVHIIVSGNQQFKVVPSSPQVYSNASKNIVVTSDTKILKNEIVNTTNIQDNQVVVMNAEDFQVACSDTNDPSNILVVYNNETVDENKQYEEVMQEQVDVNCQELETIQQIHTENSNEEMHTEQDIVHETVETWHEEAIDNVIESKENLMQASEMMEDANMETIEESNVNEHIIQEHPDIPLESDEVSSNEINKQVNNEVDNVNGIEESIECENNELTIQDNSSMETEEVDVISHNYIMENKDVDGEVVEEVANEMECMEDNLEAKKDETENAYLTNNLILDSNEMSGEVEESIENIEEEIKKQNNEQDCEEQCVEEENVNNNETVCTEDKQDEDIVEETVEEQQLIISEEVKNDILEPMMIENSSKEEAQTDKTKTVEEISHLLNEWEDNDSQSEMNTEIDNKVVTTSNVSLKDPNIEKLVSDWDEEEDEK